ncbi:MAG: hypothetical protein K9L59_05715 [Desulfobacterales bacterium]|nr:hypothetical protein [Desulfobacterales bacterium]
MEGRINLKHQAPITKQYPNPNIQTKAKTFLKVFVWNLVPENWSLSFDVAQDGELACSELVEPVEPFEIWCLRFEHFLNLEPGTLNPEPMNL